MMSSFEVSIWIAQNNKAREQLTATSQALKYPDASQEEPDPLGDRMDWIRYPQNKNYAILPHHDSS
jgi:hypothetical protein